MSRVLRSVRKRKKGHTLGAVDVIDREEYAELEVDAKVELIRSLVPLGLRHIEELLDEEVTALAGERYARKAPSVGGRRHGSNPGTVGLVGQRVPIRVPRIRHVTEREIPRRSYEALHGDRAVNDLLLRRALVQRCQWHTRENVVSYVAKREQPVWRQRLQRAYNRPEYDEALAALQSLQHELEDRNQSAAGSLAEGLDETLTLHRLGVYGVLGRSLKTTNGLESINALIEERCAKVDHWQNSSQRHRWLATALLDIEPRLRKVMGYRHLPRLRDALTRELKIDTTTSTKKAA